MPLTFIRYFTIGASLRWLMDVIKWPKWVPFKKMLAAFRAAVMHSRTARGVRAADFDPFDDQPPDIPEYEEAKEVTLSRELYDALLQIVSTAAHPFTPTYGRSRRGALILNDHVNFIDRVGREGVTFATRDGGMRDSFVVFSDPARPTKDGTLRAGQIKSIFLQTKRGR